MNKTNFKQPKFNPKSLHAFDRVLVRDNNCQSEWKCDLFSHIDNGPRMLPYKCTCCSYGYCIPYNEETKHLIGTNQQAPEFYRYWEDEVMTREEEIQKLIDEENGIINYGSCDYKVGVRDGVRLADKNPRHQTIAEYLYKEKGYPISLNGEIPTFEEIMKDVQTHNDYKAKQWLEKACKWLEQHQEYYEEYDNTLEAYYTDFEAFIIDFRKAMEE